MKAKTRREVEDFVRNQKEQLGLDELEAQILIQETMKEASEADPEEMGLAEAPAAAPVAQPRVKAARKAIVRKEMTDPYLMDSQTIKARPTRVSRIRSLLYELALPNEYIVPIGIKDATPVLGGKFLKFGKRFLKFPAAVQTVYFTSDNANRNYQGLRIDGYACWRVDPEKPEIAAKNLDFSDQDNPMGNTNRILRTICTEAIRHIIANITIEDALTKKDEIGRDLKAQLERIERSWGVTFDQVGIERVTILSSQVFDDLQQKTRDLLRLNAAESRMETDRRIEKKKSEYTEEMDRLKSEAEKESRILRATTEGEIHKIELDERTKRETEERQSEEKRRQADAEAAERAEEQKAERTKRQAERDAELKIKAAEAQTLIIEAQAGNDLAQAQAEHQKQLRIQALEAERHLQGILNEENVGNERLAKELERVDRKFQQTLRERKEKTDAEHDAETKRIQRLRAEEEVRNLISSNRVTAAFVDKLPEIAESIHIDRYTVFDGAGSSPLVKSLAQIFSIIDENGLKKLLEGHSETREKEEI